MKTSHRILINAHPAQKPGNKIHFLPAAVMINLSVCAFISEKSGRHAATTHLSDSSSTNQSRYR